MTTGGIGHARWQAVIRRVDRPDVVALSLVLAGLATWGWLASPFWLAAVIALQLIVGGIGTVVILGPVRPVFGFARYATPAVAAIAVTLLGRTLGGTTLFAAAPIAALGLLAVTWSELRLPDGRTPRLVVELTSVGICFAMAAGIGAVFVRSSWPPTVILLVIALAVPALRSSELRGRYGIEAVGQSVLHLLAVAQLGVALAVLHLPGVVGAAILALGFHAWAGAAEALDAGASGRAVLAEFGALALLGLAVAILLHAA
ncbi:MAG: hypothetical protein OEW24_01045 [Chloroflexota bacterium]|nr:hypothetical protein [Chloroflexota bacterium]